MNRTSPGGRVVGIDVIPAQPPRGASAIQGNFLSEEVQAGVREYVRGYWTGRARKRGGLTRRVDEGGDEGLAEDEVEELSRGIVELGREGAGAVTDVVGKEAEDEVEQEKELTQGEKDERDGRVVDVVLSDMSAPWEQVSGTWIRSVNNPYRRMMNTSGMPFRDHAGSMVSPSYHIILHSNMSSHST